MNLNEQIFTFLIFNVARYRTLRVDLAYDNLKILNEF